MTYKEIYYGINGMRKQAFLNKVKMIKRALTDWNNVQMWLNKLIWPIAKPLNAAGLWVGNKVGEGIYGKQTGSFPVDLRDVYRAQEKGQLLKAKKAIEELDRQRAAYKLKYGYWPLD